MNPSDRLDELLQGCIDGTLDETQERELARLLNESPEARQALRSHLLLEGGLRALAQARDLSGVNTAAGDCRALDPTEVCASRPSTRRPLLRRIVLGFAIVAAAALLVIGARHWLIPSRPALPPPAPPSEPAILAEIVTLEGKVEIESLSGEVRRAEARQPLRAGDSLRTRDGNSTAVLQFASTARLEVSPETCLRFAEDGTGGIQLIQGVVRGMEGAHAEQPPFMVTTPELKVHIEGSRYTVSSTSPESLRLDMEEGKAEVVRQRDKKALTVESGAAVLVQADVEDMTSRPMPRFVAEPRRVLDFPGAWAVFFEPDGQHLLAASYREIQRIGPEPPAEKTLLSTDTSHGRLAAFSRDGSKLAVYRGLRKDDGVIVWDVARKKQEVRIKTRIIDQRLVLAPDASWLAAVEKQQSQCVCRVWDGKTGAERFHFDAKRINALAATPDSKHLAIGLVHLGRREQNKILLVDARTGKQVAALPTNAYPLTALAFSPDGRYLAAGITGRVQIWDVEKRARLREIRGFERALTTLTFSSDGKLLAGGTQDGQVWIWKAASGEEVQVIQAGTSGVRLLAFAPDGRALVTGGIKRHPLMIWDVTPQPVQRPERRQLDKT